MRKKIPYNKLSPSGKYYRDNPRARKKKAEYDKEFNRQTPQRKKRSMLVQERRKRNIYGKAGKDVSHTSRGTKLKSVKANRGSKTDTPGDRRSRGKY